MSTALEDIQDDLIERLHAGEAIDRDAVLREHGEHADALRGFFVLLDEIERVPATDGAQPARLGEFTILREVGRGGMGVVYEAEQASLKRRVALKVLPQALGRDEQIVARFQREAEAAGRLRHPNIVPVFSVGEAAGTPFFAMELVEGRSLSEVLATRREGDDAGLPPAGEPWRAWAVQTAATIADALAYAHEKGILHRDIKPGNVILDDKGAPRLTDFGLALDMHAGALTVSGESLGTPQYMSPEQLTQRAKAVDARADIYSLGVTLYELLTLRLPYDADSTAELFAALQSGTIVPPRTVVPELDRDLEAVLLRALQVDPVNRYADASAFAADLRSVLKREPIAPAPRIRRRAPGGQRRRWVLPAVATLLLAALGAAVLLPGSGPAPLEIPDVPTAQDWVRLAEGAFGDESERLLQSWLDIRHEDRQYREMSETNVEVPLKIDRAMRGEPDEDTKPVVLLVKRQRKIGKQWLSVSQHWMHVNRLHPILAQSTHANLRAFRVILPSDRPGDLVLPYRLELRLMLRPHGFGKGERMGDHWNDIGAIQGAWSGSFTYKLVAKVPEDYPEQVSGADATERTKKYLGDLNPFMEVRVGPWGFMPPALVFDMITRQPEVPIAAKVEAFAPDGTLVGNIRSFSPPPRVYSRDTWRLGFVIEKGMAEKFRALKTVRIKVTSSRAVALRLRVDRYWQGSFEMDLPVRISTKEGH